MIGIDGYGNSGLAEHIAGAGRAYGSGKNQVITHVGAMIDAGDNEIYFRKECSAQAYYDAVSRETGY